MEIAHPISWIYLLTLVAAAKLALLVLLCRRLRQTFPAVWDELGRPFSFQRYLSPSLWRPDEVSEQTAQWELLFFIFSGQHRGLGDRAVTVMVWCARLACVLIVALFLLAIGHVPAEWPHLWSK